MKEEITLTNTVNQSNELSQKLRYHDKMSVLTAQEKLIIFFLASCIDTADQCFEEVEISIDKFCSLLNISLSGGKQRQILEESLYRLSTKGFWVVSKGGKRKEIGRWLAKGAIDYEKRTITLKLDDSLRPFFLNLQDSARTIFQLGYTVSFKRKHTCDLYALCKSAVGLKCWIIPYNDLQGLLGSGYKRYYDMDKYVLQPCLREINETSDIHVEIQPVKKSNRIVSVAFKIRNKTLREKIQTGIEQQKFSKSKHTVLTYFSAISVFPELSEGIDNDDTIRLNAQEQILKKAIQQT